MKNLILIIFGISICISAVSQRILEQVGTPLSTNFKTVTVGNNAYFPGGTDAMEGTILQKYDGTSITHYRFPMRDGIQLKQSNSGDQFARLGSSLLLVLFKISAPYTSYLYRFNGASFSNIALPGTIRSNLITYRDEIYMVLETPSGVRLYTYDGVSVREVPSSLLPSPTFYTLLSNGRYLFVSGFSPYVSSPIFLKRYDGFSFRNLPARPAYARTLSQVHEIAGTENVYLVFDDGSIFFYNGVSLTEVEYEEGIYFSSVLLWRGALYYQTSYGGAEFPPIFYRAIGATKSVIPTPPGALLRGSHHAVYRDRLYIPLGTPEGDVLYEYDGTSFVSFFPFPTETAYPSIFVRDGNLMILPKFGNGPSAFEYNGGEFNEIRSPVEGSWIFESLQSANCYHTWLFAYVDKYTYQWAVGIEEKNATCTTSGGGSIIPDRLRDYERVIIGPYGRERDWCWTGIDIDWEIIPICPVLPCKDPLMVPTMTDKNGKIAWQKTFDKPFSASIPLADTQPYTLSLGVQKDKTIGDVLIFDQGLVSSGFENVTLDMHPKDKYFYLTISTDKNKKIPFTMTLKDTKGQTMWEGKYTAPMDQLINANVSKVGDYLQFSLTENTKTNVSVYPNPSRGKLIVNVEDNSQVVQISISDLNGYVVLNQNIPSPGESILDVSAFKSGLYILTITEGKFVRKERIELK